MSKFLPELLIAAAVAVVAAVAGAAAMRELWRQLRDDQ